METAGAARSHAVICLTAESMNARNPAILGCAALANYPCRPYVIAERSSERYLAANARMCWSRSTMGNSSHHLRPTTQNPTQTTGLRGHSAAAMPAAGHSTAETILVSNHVMRNPKTPAIALFRQTSSPIAPVGKLHSLPCPWNQDNLVRIRSRAATSPATRF